VAVYAAGIFVSLALVCFAVVVLANAVAGARSQEGGHPARLRDDAEELIEPDSARR
jgi:hypothetical protein